MLCLCSFTLLSFPIYCVIAAICVWADTLCVQHSPCRTAHDVMYRIDGYQNLVVCTHFCRCMWVCVCESDSYGNLNRMRNVCVVVICLYIKRTSSSAEPPAWHIRSHVCAYVAMCYRVFATDTLAMCCGWECRNLSLTFCLSLSHSLSFCVCVRVCVCVWVRSCVRSNVYMCVCVIIFFLSIVFGFSVVSSVQTFVCIGIGDFDQSLL